MENKRESFVFYESFLLAIETLPEKEQLRLFYAITRRALYGETAELSGCTKGMFSLIEPQLEANERRYVNGLKGGRPKKSYVKKETEIKPTVFEISSENKPNENDNVNETETVNVTDNDNEMPVSDIPKTKQKKHKYGKYKNVLLTDAETESLKSKFPYDYEQKIENLSEGIELKGYKYKNHYLAVCKWAENEKKSAVQSHSFAGYDLALYEKMLDEQD